MSVGALGDSFYEYLLKFWVMTGSKDQEGRKPFDESMAVRSVTMRVDRLMDSEPSRGG